MLTRLLKNTPSVVIFWLIPLVAVVVMWNSLPTLTAQIGLLLLYLTIVALTFGRYMELPLVATVFFSILVINDLSVAKHVAPIFSTVAIFFLLPAIGLLSEVIGYEELQIRRAYWAILGLLVAQANSLFYFWPVSFFNRSLMTGVVFYALWQLLRINEHKSSFRSYVAHFAFVGLAVMVVIGLIVWTNFPQLIAF